MKRNKNIEFDTKMKELCNGVYPKNRKYLPKDWIPFDSYETDNGFYGEAFYNKNTIAIVFRGTDNIENDGLDDIKMGLKEIPLQYYDAINFFNKIYKNNPNHDIVFTGHSLGGSIAQLLGNATGYETVTFEAFGTGSFIPFVNKDNIDNIRNYGHVKDKIFTFSLKNQIGNVYLLEHKAGGPSSLLKYHFLEKIGNLKNRRAYPSNFEIDEHESNSIIGTLLKGNVTYDYDPDRIITNEEIGQMSKNEFLENEKYIMNQVKNQCVMPQWQAEDLFRSGNLIWVNAYTRDDGTEVKGYYRRK